MTRKSAFYIVLSASLLLTRPTRADDWPRWLGPEGDSVWRESGIIEKFPADGPPIRWRTPIGEGYSGPSVAHGRVYVTDRQLAEGANNPTNPFARGVIRGSERVLCLNEKDGKIIWKYEYDCPYSVSYPAGPRTAPIVDSKRVFTLGAEGNLLCLDANNGKVIWSRDFKKDFGATTPLWGFAGHPLVDGKRLICMAGGEGATVVALDKETGKELWRALNVKQLGYSTPIICKIGGQRQLIIWHPESANSLDPESGKVLWSVPFKCRAEMTIATPRIDGPWLFFTTFYSGSLMLRMDEKKPAEEVVWQTQKASEKDTTHLNAVMCTPFLKDGYIYGVCSYGQLRCLKLETGRRIWETLQATTAGEPVRWANAFIVKNGDRFFLFNEKGDLIIANFSPTGYQEISRTHLLKPTNTMAGRDVVWSHPAFANRCVYARNDAEIICADLSVRGNRKGK